MLRKPITDPLPSTPNATNMHDQSIAVQTQQCAHKPHIQALHMRTGCSCARTDRTHAPSTQHLHVRNDDPQHAQPCLPHLGTPQNDPLLPAPSSSSSRFFLDIIGSSMLTIAANIRSADANRSAPPATPQPAAATAAPAQRSLPSAAASRDTLCGLTRAPRSQARHVPYRYPFSLTRFGGGSEPYLEGYPSWRGNQKPLE
jgi:hypothetical protein